MKLEVYTPNFIHPGKRAAPGDIGSLTSISDLLRTQGEHMPRQRSRCFRGGPITMRGKVHAQGGGQGTSSCYIWVQPRFLGSYLVFQPPRMPPTPASSSSRSPGLVLYFPVNTPDLQCQSLGTIPRGHGWVHSVYPGFPVPAALAPPPSWSLILELLAL